MIEDDTEKEIRIVSILNPSELRLQVSINRMYILISSLVNDALKCWVARTSTFSLTFKTVNVKSTPVSCWSNVKSPQR